MNEYNTADPILTSLSILVYLKETLKKLLKLLTMLKLIIIFKFQIIPLVKVLCKIKFKDKVDTYFELFNCTIYFCMSIMNFSKIRSLAG